MNEKLKKLITYCTYGNETYIQAELYHYCKLKGIEILLEQSLIGCGRPDAVIMINNQPVIIECKMLSQKFNIYNEQIFKYKKSKLPILIIENKELVVEALNFLESKKTIKGIYLYNLKNKKFNRYSIKEYSEENKLNFKNLRKAERIYWEKKNG